jgi:hypothetical protein
MDVGDHPRAGYPPPKKLKPETEKRLGIASIVLVAVGLISVIRLLITGKRQAITTADSSIRSEPCSGSTELGA